MAKQFDFLARARPASLYRLLEKLTLEDAAIVLVGLPHSTAIQVMAYFPDDRQGELLPAMRDARRVAPKWAEKTAERIRELLQAAKSARESQAAPVDGDQPVASAAENKPRPPAREPAANTHPPAEQPRPLRQQSAAYQSQPPKAQPPSPGRIPEKTSHPGAPSDKDKPRPWIPRTATGSPINGPALPGKPPPVSGDPLKSPLAKAGLLDLIGRAQEKLLPKKGQPVKPDAISGQRPRPSSAAPGRPKAREGVVSLDKVGLTSTPRVIGPRAKPTPESPPPSKGRRMDGKAILAAILREAGPKVRGHVQDDDPRLFRELRGRMFFFDDLVYTEDAALARVFTTAPTEESALALKFAAPLLRDRVLRVVSPGRARALRDLTGGRAGVDDIELAQKKVLDVALQLQAAGRILIDPRDPDLAGN